MEDKPKVKIYTTPTCPYCHSAMEFFKEQGVGYEEIDVSSDTTKAQEMIDLSGQQGVPVIVVGEKVLVGFDKKALMDVLK